MRNRRYFIFTVALPVVLYLLLSRQFSGNVYGVSFRAFYMVDMAMLGAFSGALSGNAQRISQEKKDGWIRQLRLTSLPAYAYVVSKIIVSMVTTVVSVVIVLLLGRFYGNVHLAAWQWLAVAVTIWFSATIFAALAVAVGYKVRAGPGAADHLHPVLRLRHPRRHLVPAQRHAQDDRPGHPHLPGREDRHRRHRGRLRVDRPGHRPGGLARHLPRPGHRAVRSTAETV